MPKLADLFADLRVVEVERMPTDQGDVAVLNLESMTSPDTLSIRVTIPWERLEAYELGEQGNV